MENNLMHPEEINFEHNGLRCKCRKVQLTTRYWWCGYVEIPKDHPWYELDYDSSKLRDVLAPGGLTFAGRLGEKDSWWIGFDTAHSGDIWPGNEVHAYELNLSWARHWTIDELMLETKDLADKVKAGYDRNNIVNLDDLRNHEGNYCICIHCQKEVISVAVVGASWPRECPNCKALGLYKFKQSGEPPNYRQVEKCCYTCAHQSYERCNKYNRQITYDFICDDWYYKGENDG